MIMIKIFLLTGSLGFSKNSFTQVTFSGRIKCCFFSKVTLCLCASKEGLFPLMNFAANFLKVFNKLYDTVCAHMLQVFFMQLVARHARYDNVTNCCRHMLVCFLSICLGNILFL